MNIEYVGRNVDLNDDLRAFTEERLQKVARFLVEPVEIRLTLDVEKSRQIADLHVAHRYGVLQATDESHDMPTTLTAVIEKLEKQARRSKKKAKDKKRRAQRENQNGNNWPVEVLARESVTVGSQPRIIKSGNIPIKPMSIDEAALSLESSKHDFVVFRDAATDRVNVLYKRKDENYGLIAPDF
jgi:putative sigma-54 modulation protein